jgi:hypothetical protein
LQTHDGEVLKELRVHCHSLGQENRDKEITQTRRARFEGGLKELDAQYRKLTNSIIYGKAMRSIGALDKEFNVSSHYKIEVLKDSFSDGREPIARGVVFE